MIFSNDELHIMVKRMTGEICEHSSFFLIIDEILFYIKLGVPKFKKY